MPGPYFYLRDDERVILREAAPLRYALTLLVGPILVLSILLAAALLARAVVPAARVILPGALVAGWGALVALVSLVAWRRAATTEYVLTDERIYVRTGRLSTRVHFTTHDKVTDIRYQQGPFERVLGLAHLEFATAGGDVHVAGVPDALAWKAASERARDAFVRELLRESPRGTIEPEAPAAATRVTGASAPAWSGGRPSYLQGGDTPVWYERPRPISAVGSLRSLVGLLPVLFFSQAIDERWRPLVFLAAFAFVALTVGARIIQVRRTEYVATDRRIYARTGVIGTTVSQLVYEKITDIAYHQDLLGRLFGYGTVTVQTAGGGQAPITMVGLADPLAVKETIERWRDNVMGNDA